jgi:hypothetical protein
MMGATVFWVSSALVAVVGGVCFDGDNGMGTDGSLTGDEALLASCSATARCLPFGQPRTAGRDSCDEDGFGTVGDVI